MNKMWNYEPMDRNRRGTNPSDYAQVVNDIGIKCFFTKKKCKKGDTGIDYLGNTVVCNPDEDVRGSKSTEPGTLSENGALKIDMLAPIMSKPSGFPWIGGPYDQTFGAAFVTWD